MTAEATASRIGRGRLHPARGFRRALFCVLLALAALLLVRRLLARRACRTSGVRPALRQPGLRAACAPEPPRAAVRSAAATPRRKRSRTRRRVATLLAVASAALVLVLLASKGYVLEVERASAMPSLRVRVSSAQPAPDAPRYLFSIAGVSRPLGVAVAPDGDRIFVTESDGARETKVFDREGRLQGSLNPPGTSPDGRSPLYVAVSPRGQVYVSDRQAGGVHIYSPEGSLTGRLELPGETGAAWLPLALACDDQGNLLVTEISPGRHGVLKFGPDGALLRRFGGQGSGEGQFSYPNGVTVDGWGRVLIADSNNGRLVWVDGEGRPLWSAGPALGGESLALPRGLAIDDHNRRLYVADTLNHNVLAFDLREQEVKLLFKLGGQSAEQRAFTFPNGLAADRNGRLYVADRDANRVQVWEY